MKNTLSTSMKSIDAEIGASIRTFRKQANISQTALAGRLGITFQQVQKYEKGTNRVAVSTLIGICQILDIMPMDVLGKHFSADEVESNTALRRELANVKSKLASIGDIARDRAAAPVVIGVDLSTRSDVTSYWPQ